MRGQVARLAALAALQLIGCGALQAREGDATLLLGKAMQATSRLNYSGVFVYRHGNINETSRIIHFVDGGKEYEHLEVLDGSPREVVREGDEITCYLPETRTVFIEQRSEHGSFPVMLPASLGSISEHYSISTGPTERIAGHETQTIVLEPRDEYRYGHRFWVDKGSGLLLKASINDGHNELLESFAFTELTLGIAPDRARIRARLKTTEDWNVHHVAARESSRVEEGNWNFRNPLPGFRRTAGMRRQVKLNSPESLHFVFSDGLSAISVFIEPNAGAKPDRQVVNMGAINAYRRVIGSYQVLVMGDVPAAAVQRLADGIELRKKQ
ncbi:MAG TPA: MucB/RseB C-terminal domain-containing protein [Rhodocyclaceae bacterium]|nr:MucB/RseB C-terminal domain-containing protein [Rhodocyclaceae bacterium]